MRQDKAKKVEDTSQASSLGGSLRAESGGSLARRLGYDGGGGGFTGRYVGGSGGASSGAPLSEHLRQLGRLGRLTVRDARR